MNERIDKLVLALARIHNKIITKYKNVEIIEGQFESKIKTVAKVLRLQTQNINQIYNTMLKDASKVEIDITVEGYKEILDLLKISKEKITTSIIAEENNLLKIAQSFSKIKIKMFSSILEILNRFEEEQGIKHDALKSKMTIMLTIEKKDYETLQSFEKIKRLKAFDCQNI